MRQQLTIWGQVIANRKAPGSLRFHLARRSPSESSVWVRGQRNLSTEPMHCTQDVLATVLLHVFANVLHVCLSFAPIRIGRGCFAASWHMGVGPCPRPPQWLPTMHIMKPPFCVCHTKPHNSHCERIICLHSPRWDAGRAIGEGAGVGDCLTALAQRCNNHSSRPSHRSSSSSRSRRSSSSSKQ